MATFLEQLDEIAKHRADQTAIASAHGREPVTYQQFYGYCRQSIDLLNEELPDARLVPVMARKSPESLAVMIAALATGRTFSYLNPRLKPDQVRRVLKSCQCRYLVVDSTYSGTLRESLHDADGAYDLIALARGENRTPSEARASRSHVALPGAMREGGVCLFTSGSTGEPKGVLATAADLMRRADAEREWFGLSSEDRLLSVLPLSFDVGLNQVLSAFLAGSTLVICDSWLPADLLRAVEAHLITGVSAVPAIWQGFLDGNIAVDAAGRHASLRYVTVSGGDLPPVQLQRLKDSLGTVGIFKTYGQSETFRTCSLRPEEFQQRPRSVGRAFPGVEFAVLRPDGESCQPGEEGEIVHSGLGTMVGYLGATPATEDIPSRQVRTGDYGYVDAEGYLFLQGRKDDMLKVHGNRVFPGEVASLIAEFQDVAEAFVVGGRNERGGHLLLAFIALRPGVSSTTAEMQRECVKRLAGYMVPTHLYLLDQLPRTHHGKPDRHAMLAFAGPEADSLRR